MQGGFMPNEMISLSLDVGVIDQIEGQLKLKPKSPTRPYDAINYWQHHEKLQMNIKLDDKVHVVKYVLAPVSFLDMLYRGEKFGCYINDMMFISSQLADEHPNWVPYIIIKLFGENFIDPGLDKTGRVQHWDSLYRSIRIVGATMEEGQLREFLTEITKYDQSRFFELDQEVKNFLEQGDGDALIAKRSYLEHHNYNRWVAKGRMEEDLFEMTQEPSGFRNHAEAILRNMGDLSYEEQFLVGRFVNLMIGIPGNTPIVISPPFNAIAYFMTLEMSGIANLVIFDETFGSENHNDLIVKVPGKHRTWMALAKRLSFGMHKTEEAVQKILATKRDHLNGLIVTGKTLATSIEKSATKVGKLVSKGFFAEAQEVLSTSSEFEPELIQLRNTSNELSASLVSLQRVAETLRTAI